MVESLHHEQRVVWFTGHVQGVGFRYATQALSQPHDVVGYVQNLPDGRVKLVVEGGSGEVKQMIEAVKDRMGGYISRTEEEVLPARGEFDEFCVRY